MTVSGRDGARKSALTRYLAMVEPEQRALVRSMDALIRKAAPDLDASLKWGNLTYHHAKNVCALVVHVKYLNIQVWLAATIPDPHGVLLGSGKRMRHIKVSADRPIKRRAIAAIVRAAAAAQRRESPS
jgi:hypothetical protein